MTTDLNADGFSGDDLLSNGSFIVLLSKRKERLSVLARDAYAKRDPVEKDVFLFWGAVILMRQAYLYIKNMLQGETSI